MEGEGARLAKTEVTAVEGVVQEVPPNTTFRVLPHNGASVLA